MKDLTFKEITKLIEIYNRNNGTRLTSIRLFDDGSGRLIDDLNDTIEGTDFNGATQLKAVLIKNEEHEIPDFAPLIELLDNAIKELKGL